MVGAVVPAREASGANVTALGLCCLVAAIEGFDLQSAGVAAPRLVAAFGLAPSQLGLFFSASTLGLLVGAAFGGRISDRLGRKRTLLAAVAVFGLMSILTGLAARFDQLVAARLLTGVGLGGALPNLIALVAETASPAYRGRAVAALYAGLPVGGVLASLATLVDTDPGNWSGIFVLGGVAPLAVIPLLAAWLPAGGGPAAPGRPARSVPDALFGEGRAVATALLWTGFLLGLFVFYLLLNWLPSLLISRGLPRADASWVQVAFNLGGALGSVATGLLMDRWNRAASVALIFGCSIAALVLLAAVPASLALMMAAGFLIGATASGAQMALYALAPSCYPTEMRGTGVGAAVSVGRLGSVVGPLFAGVLLKAGQSPIEVLLVLVPLFALSGLAATLLACRVRPA
ncbi:major facilitator superfamily MFS_1 [Methylobacterium sp. 4-46]|uniref:3-(3-hydroxy-phenyl)propionate transporter MhpT n=1 Tax=unclassified Methylobacterium TaxID=2615210 RepID=UPI000152E981|nr:MULTISPECIES: 3-(3-hydroxy-phenyl)propionate transporter MhpT [Methylobacterium]ACA17861.1 major facilitator superfamily MFS_1 [Methylobacterium sp. 4-46]WFT77163.1 3-(3-hydroxy-phenyl)propionate transporter MhpT [Methylobacterium nodulans]